MALAIVDGDDQFHLYWRIDDYNVEYGGKMRLDDGKPIGASGGVGVRTQRLSTPHPWAAAAFADDAAALVGAVADLVGAVAALVGAEAALADAGGAMRGASRGEE